MFNGFCLVKYVWLYRQCSTIFLIQWWHISHLFLLLKCLLYFFELWGLMNLYVFTILSILTLKWSVVTKAPLHAKGLCFTVLPICCLYVSHAREIFVWLLLFSTRPLKVLLCANRSNFYFLCIRSNKILNIKGMQLVENL